MFFIGEGIFYPKYGAGYIINIEDKEIYGNIKKYYIIRLIINDILTMIPVEFEESKRLRKVIEKDDYYKVIEILRSKCNILPIKWADRYKHYNKCISDGNIFKLAEVLRDIYNMPRKKEVSKSDMKAYDEILCMIASELSILLDVELQKMKIDILDIFKE